MSRNDEPSCCGPECGRPSADATPTADRDRVRDRVRAGYAEIARSGSWSNIGPAPGPDADASGGCGGGGGGGDVGGGGGGCCGPTTLSPGDVARAVGYADEDLTLLPEGSNLGLSCGNPTALASLQPGEVVLDLGAGAGFDCFLAGPRVGASGRVIGVDMTAEMLARAREGLATYRARSGLDNVEFRLGEIEHLPVADASVDVVISNCVINLSPDKRQVWREIARVLRPGRRVAVSDLALLKPLPDADRADLDALVGCIAGADLVDDVRAAVLDAGLRDLQLTAKPQYVEAMTSWEDPLYRRIAESLPAGTTMGDHVVSLEIAARRG